MKRVREETEDLPPPKKNKLLNPLLYDDWKESSRSEGWICYESSRNLGIPVYSDSKEDGMVTSIVSKKEDAKVFGIKVKETPCPPPRFDGSVEVNVPLSKEYPASVRASIAALVKDVIAACSAEPKALHPHLHAREVVEEEGAETHYFYTIEYDAADPPMTITLPLALPSSAASPHAKDVMLLSMADGKMVFTFCVKDLFNKS